MPTTRERLDSYRDRYGRDSNVDLVKSAYKDFLGRDPENENALNMWANHDRGIEAAISMIAYSPEAREYWERSQITGATNPPPAGREGQPGGRTPRAPEGGFQNTPYTDRGSGGGGSIADKFTGYDFGQDANNRLLGKSAKYTLADGVRRAIEERGANPEQWHTKGGAQAFAEQYLTDFLEQHGIEVLQIKGDKIFMRDWEDRANGREGSWVDWVINADGSPMGLTPKLGFQVERNENAFGAIDPYTATPGGPPAPPPGPPPPGQPPPGGDQPPGPPPPEGDIGDDAYMMLADRRPLSLSAFTRFGTYGRV